MDNIITSIPSLLLYAVPGFFGVSILRKLTHRQIKGDFLWVESIGISALSVAFVRSICSAFGNGITENSLWIWCVVLNVATATGMAQIFRCPKFATFMVRHFSISFLDGVLPNAIDWVNGSEVYLKLKTTREMWCGAADTVSHPTDPAQWICIVGPIKINENYERVWPAVEGGTDGNRMVFHLEDVEYIRFV